MLQKANLTTSILHGTPSWQFDRPVIIQKHLSLTILGQSSETKQVALEVFTKQTDKAFKAVGKETWSIHVLTITMKAISQHLSSH